MASIFISHSSRNNAWARKLQVWLEAKHHRSLFLDFDRETGLRAGDLWERQLYAKLLRGDNEICRIATTRSAA